MKIVSDLKEECIDGINTYLKLEEYSDNSDNENVLFYGIASTNNAELQEEHKNYKRRILLDLWSPCQLYSNDIVNRNYFQQCSYFTDVFSICPYTVQWANEQTKSNKWKYVFYPLPNLRPKSFEKKYDVCFVGGIHSQDHVNAIETIKDMNYRFISQGVFPHVTNYNISTQEKLDIIAQSKITICFNLLYLTVDQCHFAMNYYNLTNNAAFNNLEAIGSGPQIRYTIPQFKSRLHEAAIGKSLILLKKDNWCIEENYYDKHEFARFSKIENLKLAIESCLKNYDDLQPVIESAYNKVQNYTPQNLVRFIKDNL